MRGRTVASIILGCLHRASRAASMCGVKQEEHMPELICELIVTLDGFARGERSPAYYGYFDPDFDDWLKTNSAVPYRMLSRTPAIREEKIYA
jgi:hypothetical protein